jgi:hypothetical protein
MPAIVQLTAIARQKHATNRNRRKRMSDDNDNRIDYRQMYAIPGKKRRSRSGPTKSEKPKPEPTGFFARTREKEISPRSAPRKKPPPARIHYDPDRPRKKLILVAKAMLANNPDISLADMKEELDTMGYKISAVTIGGIRQEFFETIRIAVKAGYIRVVR